MTADVTPGGFQILQTLGQGHEGTVYKALKDGQRYVVKIFKDRPSGRAADLVAYSERVRVEEAGLFPVDLIYEEERLAGLCYRYVPLFCIPWDVFRRSARLRQALLSQYCFTQAWLMRVHSLEMVDGPQFLMGRDGRFYYIDYGSTIVRTDNEWCRTRGYVVFSLLCVLFEPNGMQLDDTVRQPGFEYCQPCAFVKPAQYEALLRCSPWAAPVVERIRQSDAEIFLDPDFYAWIAGLYRPVVPGATWFIARHKLRRVLARSH